MIGALGGRRRGVGRRGRSGRTNTLRTAERHSPEGASSPAPSPAGSGPGRGAGREGERGDRRRIHPGRAEGRNTSGRGRIVQPAVQTRQRATFADRGSRMARIAGREEMAPRRRQNAVVFRFARTTDGKPADPGHGDVGMALVDPPPTLGRKRHIARFMPEQEGEAGRFAGQPSERRIRPRGRDRSVRDERRQRARPPRRRDRIPADVTFLCIAHFRRAVAHSTLWS